jgi:hypothetical protein
MSDHSLPKTPGELISEAREAQNLTIAQLSERTKIPPPVLASLELDEFHKVSGALYIKSFLRTCALDLGLDPQTVLNQYNKFSGERKTGPVGAEMVWKEDEVQINRVGLPWLRIMGGLGLAAVLVGLGLFMLRGCGKEPATPGARQISSDGPVGPENMVAAVVQGDSAAGGEFRRESLIPSSTETQLRQRAAAREEKARGGYARGDSANIPPDSLAVGWLMHPPPVSWETEESPDPGPGGDLQPQTEMPEETATVQDDQQPTEAPEELAPSPVPEIPVVIRSEDSQTQESPQETKSEEILNQDAPAQVLSEQNTISEIQDDGGTDSGTETEMENETVTPGTVDEPPHEEPSAVPPVAAQLDSSWPLVLRVSCDAPQEILVKRDGDSQFNQVRWPDELSPAAPVPAAGFEAGRAYIDGQRLVVFWGAEDHFSLKLANVRGVEVSINGSVRDIGRLRPGQELILDSHSADSTPER